MGLSDDSIDSYYHHVLEQILDPLVAMDSDQIVTFINPSAERLWGQKLNDVVGRPFSALVADWRPTADPDPDRDVDDVGGHSVTENQTIRIERAPGDTVLGLLSLSKVNVDNKIGFLGIVRDVTDDMARRKHLRLLAQVADETRRIVIITDDRERIVYVNRAFIDTFRYSSAEVIGAYPSQILAGRYTDRRTLARLQRQMSVSTTVQEEILAYDRDGHEIWVSATANVVRNAAGKVTNLIAVLADITESRQIQSLQREALEALANERSLGDMADVVCRKIAAIAPDVVPSILHVDPDGRLHPLAGCGLPDEFAALVDGVSIGPDVGTCGVAAFHGRPALTEDIEGDPNWAAYRDLPLAAGLRACWSSPVKARDGRVVGTLAFYFRDKRAPGPWHVRIADAVVHLCALAIERHEARSQISRLAYFDSLTGLPNRMQLRASIDRMIASPPDSGRIAILFLDIDHFKDVNDGLGHSAGDALLVHVAHALKAQLRPEDIVSRQGGDEFVIVMPDCSLADASVVAARIQKSLSQPVWIGSQTISVSASIGISAYPEHGTNVDTLLMHSDMAMYEAKRSGRAGHCLFDLAIRGRNEERRSYAAALRQAVSSGGLTLHYQPQISLISGEIIGVEALARWRDPILGEVPPATFIDIAEEYGLIESIGDWSLLEACRQIADWRAAGLAVPRVSVNLSPLNFQSDALPATIERTLRDLDLPPHVLTIEMTESAVMDERSATLESARAIQALGVGLSMDDFGTGYSNLSRLARLPMKELKIDRSFVADLATDATARAVAALIVQVGASLGLAVVAEGVETLEQKRALEDMCCPYVQGYLYSPALPARALEQWATEHSASRMSAHAPDHSSSVRDRTPA